MGQRLVVTIHNNNKEIAKVYFHWSAYSYDALLEAQRIVKCIYNHEDETEKELKLRLVRFCEANGGGIDGGEDSTEFKFVQAMYPNETFVKENYSRTYGLIALSEDGMDDMQSYSEGDLDIYLDDETVCNGIYNYYESLEEYNRELQECDEEPKTLDDIVDIGYDISEIDIKDLDDVVEKLRNVDDVCRYGNEIFELT